MNKPKSLASNIVKTLILPVSVFAILFLLSLFMGQGQFASLNNMETILRNTMVSMCIALAMTCNMLNNRWDFSVGMMVVLAPVIAMPFVQALNAGPMGVLIGSIIVGCIAGLINGTVYLLVKVPPLVTSIGMMLVYESVILVYNGGLGARISDYGILKLGMSPWIFIVGLCALALFYVLFTFTRFGYNVRALANQQELAVSAGINERRNVLGCYLLCGFMAGVAGAIYLSMSGALTATVKYNGAMTIMFEAFPPVFIGFYLSRYTNLTVGVLVGAFTMKLLTAGMLALGISSSLQTVGVGLFLLVFIAFTTNQARFHERRAVRKRVALISGRMSAGDGE